MVKILEATIKIIDDKNHVRILTKDDIDLESITIKQKVMPRPIPKEVKKKDEPEKSNKKTSKKNSKKK